MRFDLCGIGIGRQAERLNEVAGKPGPVNFWISAEMGIVVADCAIDFTENGHRINLIELPLHTVDRICQLLTHGTRRSRLAVRSGEQGLI